MGNWHGEHYRLYYPKILIFLIQFVLFQKLESNGSSSMATVCGASLSMMDAGVPLKSAVAGVAMGLILEGKEYAVLTDILGDEDHLGDMDFKVAGTSEGITSLQMDIKVAGITPEIMEKALEQANKGRIHILEEMSKSISEAGEFSKYAPKIETLKIATDKIRRSNWIRWKSNSRNCRSFWSKSRY